MSEATSRCTKAVVLARGLGTRMRRAVPGAVATPGQAAMADQGVKAMIAMTDDRPFLDYILSGLADAGITNIGVVIGPEHDVIRRRYDTEVALSRLKVTFLIQSEPRGTADAVLAAEEFAAGEPFLVVNGDNLYPRAALEALAALPGSGLVGYRRDSLIAASNIEPERIARFALIWLDRTGGLARVVEKPHPAEATTSDLISMNSWRFGSAIFEACRAIGPSTRGELELQDAVSYAITELGERFEVVVSAEGVLDLSTRADIEAVAGRLALLPVVL